MSNCPEFPKNVMLYYPISIALCKETSLYRQLNAVFPFSNADFPIISAAVS